jgi:dynein heavy chain, axonemal
LKAVEEKIDSLERMFKEKKELEESLQAQIDDCMKKLGRANKIIAGLAGEKTRWTQTVERLTEDYGYIIGNCLVGAGGMSYSGPFTALFRQQLENEWRQKIQSLNITLRDGISMK